PTPAFDTIRPASVRPRVPRRSPSMSTDERTPNRDDDAPEPDEEAARAAEPQGATGLRPPDDPVDPKMDRSKDVARLAKHSYLAGFAGALAVMGMGYLGARRHMLQHGWRLYGDDFNIHRSMAFVLLIIAIAMFSVELFIRIDVDKGRLIKISSLLKQGKVGDFIAQCVFVYLADVTLLSTG